MSDKTNQDLPEGLSGENHPLETVAASAKTVADSGGWVYQKFTCEACGNRLTIDVKNTFYTKGSCDQCGHITDITKTGCNFLAVWPLTEKGMEVEWPV
jgi:hypothetical protein